MIVFRVGKAKYAADLSGEGARLFGGRWNEKGTLCLYSSASRALSLLEYSVNVNVDDIPRSLTVTTIEIPDDVLELSISDLPGNWKENPAPADTARFGSALLQTATKPVIQIPSAVIPEEFNYLLNPRHPDKNLFKVLDIKDLVYDIRIKTV